MIGRLKVALAAAALTVLIVGCLPADGTPVNTPVPGDVGSNIAVYFGDSLCWDASSRLTVFYVADPAWRTSLNCFGGTQFESPSWVQKYSLVGNAPSQSGAVVVIALGSNDITLDANLDITKLQLADAVIKTTNARASAVVVPNLSTTALTGARLTKTQQWNAWLRQVDASADPTWRALRVADFQACSTGHPEWYIDPVHQTLAGQTAYAQFLYQQRTPGLVPC